MAVVGTFINKAPKAFMFDWYPWFSESCLNNNKNLLLDGEC